MWHCGLTKAMFITPSCLCLYKAGDGQEVSCCSQHRNSTTIISLSLCSCHDLYLLLIYSSYCACLPLSTYCMHAWALSLIITSDVPATTCRQLWELVTYCSYLALKKIKSLSQADWTSKGYVTPEGTFIIPRLCSVWFVGTYKRAIHTYNVSILMSSSIKGRANWSEKVGSRVQGFDWLTGFLLKGKSSSWQFFFAVNK